MNLVPPDHTDACMPAGETTLCEPLGGCPGEETLAKGRGGTYKPTSC